MASQTGKTSNSPRSSGAVRALLGESGLDSSQQAFCEEPSTSVRLLAPAGSGKTLSVLWRCLAAQEAAKPDPARFLIFTFTRAARDELRERIRTNADFAALGPYVEVTTLNAWGFRRLKSRLFNVRLLTASDQRFWAMANTLQPLWHDNDRMKALLTDNRRKNRGARALMDLMDTLKSLGFRHDRHNELDDFCAHAQWLNQNGMRAQVEQALTKLRDLEIISALEKDAERSLEEMFEQFGKFWCQACFQRQRLI